MKWVDVGVKRNRIIAIVEKRELLQESLVLLGQQFEIYQAKGSSDVFSHLTIFSYHLIVVALNQETEVVCQFVESIRKIVMTPIMVLLSEDSRGRNRVIHAGADVALTRPYTAEEISLQAYTLIRRYTEWKSEERESNLLIVSSLEINIFQRTVSWNHKKLSVVKREFDFLYLLASTPGRVYTYSQIYQLVWQEYPHGDITNIIYCMVHRLKQKLKKIDVSAEYIISSVKEIGYCLKVYNES